MEKETRAAKHACTVEMRVAARLDSLSKVRSCVEAAVQSVRRVRA